MKKWILIVSALLLSALVISCCSPKTSVSPGQGDYVVLLHGLGRTSNSMKKMERRLSGKGFSVVNINYPSNKKSVDDLIPLIETNVLLHCTDERRKIHFIGHSLGSILAKEYAQRHPSARIGRIVMLAPPSKGSEVTDHLKGLSLYRKATGPAGQQLGTEDRDRNDVQKTVKQDIGVIAGSFSWNPLFSYWIPGRDDGKVSVENTKVQGMKDFLEVNTSHTFIMQRKEVIDQAVSFLQTGRFKADIP